MSCIFYASNLINNLAELITNKAVGLQPGDWMIEALHADFSKVLELCF